MAKKKNKNTRGRIVSAAWELFYEQGYDETTIDEIVERSETSKGSFYHYFDGKDALLSSMAYLFDDKYQQLSETLDPNMSSFDALIYLNHELFLMVENSIPLELMARLLSSQLIISGDRSLLDQGRFYYRFLRKIIAQGQKRGDLRTDVSVNEIVKAYALCERAILYDWCICNGDYCLYHYSRTVLSTFLKDYVAQKPPE